MWQFAFPPELPTRELDFDTIDTIAFNSATLATTEEAPISMAHILRAARAEYQKLEKTLTESEVRCW